MKVLDNKSTTNERESESDGIYKESGNQRLLSKFANCLEIWIVIKILITFML